MRPSWVEIDLGAIRHNVRSIAEAVSPAAIAAVVKADAYGHGDVPVAEAALEAGATWLAVATVAEGIRLREADLGAPILLLSEPLASDLEEAHRYQLTPTGYTGDFLPALRKIGEGPIAPHVKLDTGMHRVGADHAAALEIARSLNEKSQLGGLWTHFPDAEGNAEFTKQQIDQLARLVEAMRGEGIDPGIVHAANSAGALLYPESRWDMVRIGLAMYGCYPSPECRDVVELRPAMRVVSRVAHVQQLHAGSRPSYGRIRPLEEDGVVATVPIGYADGVTRRLSRVGGSVLIGGKRRPYAGSVTMDQIIVVGSDEVAVGDEVVLLGAQGEETIEADEWAGLLDTVSWEILCGFGPRLPRRYQE